MNKKAHILIIPSWYPRFHNDILGSFFREQALALHKNGYEVGVIYPQIRSLKDIRGIFFKPYGVEIFNDCGLNTYKWHQVNHLPRAYKHLKNIWIFLGLKLFDLYVDSFGLPDIIHVHSMKPAGYLALAIKKKYNIPYIITEHSSAFARGLISSKEIAHMQEVVDKSSYNIAVSESFVSLLNKTFKNVGWSFLPNIVSDFYTDHEVINIPYDKFSFICIASLIKSKALDVLIEAFSITHKRLPNITLNIGGDGPEKSNLIDLVKKLNLENEIKFLGQLSRDEVVSAVSNSSAFILPSRYETFGVVAIEALALGKPVIATRCGGPESIITEEVGVLVDIDDVASLSNEMERMYLNYCFYDSKKIQEYSRNNFSENAITSKLSRIYDLVLTNPLN